MTTFLGQPSTANRQGTLQPEFFQWRTKRNWAFRNEKHHSANASPSRKSSSGGNRLDIPSGSQSPDVPGHRRTLSSRRKCRRRHRRCDTPFASDTFYITPAYADANIATQTKTSERFRGSAPDRFRPFILHFLTLSLFHLFSENRPLA